MVSGRMRRWIAPLAATAGLMGCSSGTSAPPPARAAVGRNVPPLSAIPGIAVTVGTDRAAYRAGDPIQITVSATHNGNAPRTIRYPNPNPEGKWGYIIAQGDKIVTYEYWEGHGVAFIDVISADTYAPGETKQYTYAFPYSLAPNDPDTIRALAPGTYTVYARMPALYFDGPTPVRHDTPTPASAPITITITN